jgi:hypothetical protein
MHHVATWSICTWFLASVARRWLVLLPLLPMLLEVVDFCNDPLFVLLCISSWLRLSSWFGISCSVVVRLVPEPPDRPVEYGCRTIFAPMLRHCVMFCVHMAMRFLCYCGLHRCVYAGSSRAKRWTIYVSACWKLSCGWHTLRENYPYYAE